MRVRLQPWLLAVELERKTLDYSRRNHGSDLSHRKSATAAGAPSEHPSRVSPATPHRPQPRFLNTSRTAPLLACASSTHTRRLALPRVSACRTAAGGAVRSLSTRLDLVRVLGLGGL